MDKQGEKLMKTLGVAVATLDKMDTLVPILQGLGKKVRFFFPTSPEAMVRQGVEDKTGRAGTRSLVNFQLPRFSRPYATQCFPNNFAQKGHLVVAWLVCLR